MTAHSAGAAAVVSPAALHRSGCWCSGCYCLYEITFKHRDKTGEFTVDNVLFQKWH